MTEKSTILYYENDEKKAPYLLESNIAPDDLTLSHLKTALIDAQFSINSKCSFFFQTILDDIG